MSNSNPNNPPPPPPPPTSPPFTSTLTSLLNASALSTALGIASRTGLLATLAKTDTYQSVQTIATSGSGFDERYLTELLAILVSGGIIDIGVQEDDSLTYSLSREKATALTSMGLYFEELPILSQCAYEPIITSLQTGAGVNPSVYSEFGAWMGRVSSTNYSQTLIQKFIPSLGPEIVSKLEEGCTVVDLGCGEGVACFLIAQAFTKTTVIGVDCNSSSILAAREHCKCSGLDNLTYIIGDASDCLNQSTPKVDFPNSSITKLHSLIGKVDLALSFDSIHDLPAPSAALQTARRLLSFNGVFGMVDIKASSKLVDNVNHPMAPFLYTVSLMHCLPQGLCCAEAGGKERGEGLGMMWGREKALEMLSEAGFGNVEVKDLEHDTFNYVFLCRLGAI